MKAPKFRAWSKFKNKMIDVWYMSFVGDTIQIVSDGDNFYLYDESELMQFTGLCDNEDDMIVVYWETYDLNELMESYIWDTYRSMDL